MDEIDQSGLTMYDEEVSILLMNYIAQKSPINNSKCPLGRVIL
tara:strand:- start:143 stop:271 length:129 start_codon:yes stop_codon:yes gene_type:complete